MIQELNDTNFEAAIRQIDTPILIDFYGANCSPCKTLAEAFLKSSETFDGKVAFIQMDVEQSSEICAKYLIRAIPTLVLVHDGKLIVKNTGAISHEEIHSMIKKSNVLQ